ncbi:MAG: potassium-transporting ATPase subunit KdpC [Phycisphaerales bacterium]|nr:potassium-transporting ATPase subunit KdpC [Planctomycetota bacterium]
MKLLRPAISLFVVLSILTGVAYPLVITGIAQLAFPHQANGSIIIRAGTSAGSTLIGQPFSDPKYFWGRLSATSPVPYTAFNAEALTGSSGSNLAQSNPAFRANIDARIDALAAADKAAGFERPRSPAGKPASSAIPVDLLTSSASGLDPHISPEAAAYQVPRVALARGLRESVVLEQVRLHTTPRQLGFLGEPVVNVLALNMALDGLSVPKAPTE